MKLPLKYRLLLLLVAALAAGLRVWQLDLRPMHGDEAVHAIKFGRLLEQGRYEYNRNEFHGPTLNYLTLISAWAGGAKNLTQVTEFTLRIVPVFFGAVLILLLLPVADGIGVRAAVVAGILMAISPAMVFYSRYYIQETLLVCFTFGLIVCGYRYARSGKIGWAVLAGVCAGLMHATKETCIIAFGAMLLALLLVVRRRGESKTAVRLWHVIAAIAVALAVSALFYSSFFTNPRGITDSWLAIIPYFCKATQNQLHIHPWYYYLHILTYFKLYDGPLWSEALIVIVALAGLAAAFTNKTPAGVDLQLIRFFAFYTLIMTVIYSLIPYKTPWCVLGFLHGLIILAGVGIVEMINARRSPAGKALVGLVFIVGLLHLGRQSYLANYKYYADQRNPYVYAHPTTDVLEIAKRVEAVAAADSQGRNIYIQVVCTKGHYWPLPWYLRSFPNVGWWDKVEQDVPAAPLIIASADMAPSILAGFMCRCLTGICTCGRQ
jgi:uncharacterized protein (TIGR03663 family)